MDSRGSIADVAVHVDAGVPIHPLTVSNVDEMVRAGILGEDDRVELLDGVLVEMSPPSEEHSYAVCALTMLAARAADAAGFVLSVQNPLEVASRVSRPQPDLAIVPVASARRDPHGAVLAIEVAHSSQAIDLGRKAVTYAKAGIPEYWVLDLERRELVVHRRPDDGRYGSVHTVDEHGSITAQAVRLTVSVSPLLPPV